MKELLKLLPKAAKETYILTYFPTSIGGFDTRERFGGEEGTEKIPAFLHGVYMDANKHDCNHK